MTAREELAEILRRALIDEGYSDSYDACPWEGEVNWLADALAKGGSWLITDGEIHKVTDADRVALRPGRWGRWEIYTELEEGLR